MNSGRCEREVRVDSVHAQGMSSPAPFMGHLLAPADRILGRRFTRTGASPPTSPTQQPPVPNEGTFAIRWFYSYVSSY